MARKPPYLTILALVMAVAGCSEVPSLETRNPSDRPTIEVNPAETCEVVNEGSACWLELDSHPGCYIWTNMALSDESADWSGQCESQIAQGFGVLSIPSADEPVVVQEAQFVDGKLQGIVVTNFANGDVAETPYVSGEVHGTSILRRTNGDTMEAISVNGVRQRQITRRADGGMIETPYVNEVKHGTEIERHADGVVFETPYVNGVIHGTHTVTIPSVGRQETPFVNGVEHGTAIMTTSDGSRTETPYVSGVKHGTEITWINGRIVQRTLYVNGVESDPSPADSNFDLQGTYQVFCFACHSTGLSGAPIPGDVEALGTRMEKGREEIIEIMNSGLNAMPPKGLCTTCTEDQLWELTQYMVNFEQ